MTDLGTMLLAQLNALNERFAAGINAGKRINAEAHRALMEQYVAASADPVAKIPTALELAIIAVLSLNDERKINDYANAGVKRDQLARDRGRPEDDLTTHGTPMRAGS